MKVYNETKTQELKEYDLKKGYLKRDTITHYFEEVKEVKEQGYFVTIAEYENGGKDVDWIVDVEGVEYQPAREEVEDIYVFIPYTKEELKEIEINERIAELKELLSNTDYKAIKFAEGEMTHAEYEPIREQRKAWRSEINKLENE